MPFRPALTSTPSFADHAKQEPSLFDRTFHRPKNQLKHRPSAISLLVSSLKPQPDLLTARPPPSPRSHFHSALHLPSKPSLESKEKPGRHRKQRSNSLESLSTVAAAVASPSASTPSFLSGRISFFNKHPKPAVHEPSPSLLPAKFVDVDFSTSTVELPLEPLDFSSALRSSLDRIQKEGDVQEMAPLKSKPLGSSSRRPVSRGQTLLAAIQLDALTSPLPPLPTPSFVPNPPSAPSSPVPSTFSEQFLRVGFSSNELPPSPTGLSNQSRRSSLPFALEDGHTYGSAKEEDDNKEWEMMSPISREPTPSLNPLGAPFEEKSPILERPDSIRSLPSPESSPIAPSNGETTPMLSTGPSSVQPSSLGSPTSLTGSPLPTGLRFASLSPRQPKRTDGDRSGASVFEGRLLMDIYQDVELDPYRFEWWDSSSASAVHDESEEEAGQVEGASIDGADASSLLKERGRRSPGPSPSPTRFNKTFVPITGSPLKRPTANLLASLAHAPLPGLGRPDRGYVRASVDGKLVGGGLKAPRRDVAWGVRAQSGVVQRLHYFG